MFDLITNIPNLFTFEDTKITNNTSISEAAYNTMLIATDQTVRQFNGACKQVVNGNKE